jgi:hypothetical protein
MEIAQSIEIMKSLADSSRLRVLNSLMENSQYVEELASRLNLAVSTVSFHLKKLEKAGLIYKTKEQYYITYHVCDNILNQPLINFTKCENLDKFIEDERIEKYRQKVLNTFFKKNKLIKLPVQKKKKLIILEEFLKKIKSDKKYTETEINEIILQHYDDYCIVRRLMIEEGMMKRKNQIYWLNKKKN